MGKRFLRTKRSKTPSEENTLLQDSQLERGLLCSLFNDITGGSRVKAYRMFLQDDDFTDESCRVTWQWMKDVVDSGQEMNMVNVYSMAASKGKKWDMSRFIQLQGSEGDADLMAITLSTMGIKRRLNEELRTIVMDIEYNTELSPAQIVSDIEKLVEATQQQVKPKTLPWMNLYMDIVNDYKLVASGEVITGNKCGFDLIDDKGGFELGELMVIGARTSNGKTAFTLNCAVNLAMRGVPVGIFSLEMTNKQLAIRIAAIMGDLDSTSIKQGTLKEHELDTFTMLNDRLPLYFDDVRSSEIDVIISNIKGMVMQHGVQVVVLDYLQLMRSREIDRVHQIGGIAHRLEALSKQLEITIVLISQLRRNVDKDPCPKLEELKESGDIADAADSIFLIYRPEQHGSFFRYPHMSKDWSSVEIKGTAMLMCVKNRQGMKPGEQILGFKAEATRFYQLDELKPINNNLSPKTPF